MSGTRPSLFEEADELDLGQFAAKSAFDASAIPADVVRKISEEGGFPSRTASLLSAPRRSAAKTGRTVLLNARITQRAHDKYHDIVEFERARYEAGQISHRVTLGEVVERALAALEREIGEKAL